MTTPNDELIIDYLLGVAAPEDTERLDQLSVTDEGFADRIRAVEYDLLDACARGDLPAGRLEQCAALYLASPKQHEKLQNARSFLATIDKLASERGPDAKPAAHSQSRGLTRRVTGARWFWGPTLSWGLVAAVVVLASTVVYLVLENRTLRNQVSASRSELAGAEKNKRELEDQLAARPSGSAGADHEPPAAPGTPARVERGSSRGGNVNRGLTASGVLAVNLFPQIRGAGQSPAITVSSTTQSVAVTLALEATGFPAYRTRLKNAPEGEMIWRSGRLTASRDGKSIRLSLPASLLKSQRYVLELSGIASNGADELVGIYAFRIARQ